MQQQDLEVELNIAQVLWADSWGEVTPETIEKGLGGRETAMVKLAQAWADQGHEVTNFVNVEKGRRFETYEGYHEYIPINLTRGMLGNMPWDSVIAWEVPSIFSDQAIRENAGVTICEMQVAHFKHEEMEWAEQVDYVAALSPWHAQFLIHSGLEMKRGEVISLPNGIDPMRYPEYRVNKKIQKYKTTNNPKFVYSSSPDRGLWHLLKIWPDIRKIYPEAEIFVTYGFSDYVNTIKWSHSRTGEMAVELIELIEQPGVHNIGKIGQTELAEMQMDATAWLYPLDALWPTETGCITAVENAAAGNPLIITDGDCLKSEFGEFSKVSELPFDKDDFIGHIQSVLDNPNTYKELARKGYEFSKTRSWRRISKQWLRLFENAHFLVH